MTRTEFKARMMRQLMDQGMVPDRVVWTGELEAEVRVHKNGYGMAELFASVEDGDVVVTYKQSKSKE